MYLALIMSENTRPKPVVLISMDGVGVARPSEGNAVTSANTPNLDKYWPLYPHTYLEASGVQVGLSQGIDGNSEVGHMAMGAGKIIFQDLPRIDNAIQNNSFFQNPVLIQAFEHAEKNNSSVHLLGLVGTGKVHSSMDHLFALLKFAKERNFDPDKLFIHAVSDGRDSPSQIVLDILDKIQSECIRMRIGRVVSLMGRFYGMDRDNRWERTQLAYELLTTGKGHVLVDLPTAIADSYKQGKTDEFIEPSVLLLDSNDKPHIVQSNDSVIFFNFRPDRARQITSAFVEEDFSGFARDKIDNLFFVTLTEYRKDLDVEVAFPPESSENFLGKVLSDNKLRQLRLAESEKFAHVTYFFNAGHETPMPGEDRIEVPSPKDVPTYDLKPEMSMIWLTDVTLEKIEKGGYDFILVNFAGPDMVGHTGVIDAAIKSMEITDECIGRIVEKTLEIDGAVIITADHGNAEEMIDLQTGEPDTKHSVNPVPVIIIQKDIEARELTVGNLADIAPTVLAIMGIEKPAEMTGRNLLS